MAGWLGINSSHIDSLCGEEVGLTLAVALDGTYPWAHNANENHWFIIDLGQIYNITKVRGRSSLTDDPIDIDIFVSMFKAGWGAAVVYNVTTWQDTEDWVVINVTAKEGRYLLVRINDTEDAVRNLGFGNAITPFTIFDVYGEVVRKSRARSGLHYIKDGGRLRGFRKDSPY